MKDNQPLLGHFFNLQPGGATKVGSPLDEMRCSRFLFHNCAPTQAEPTEAGATTAVTVRAQIGAFGNRLRVQQFLLAHGVGPRGHDITCHRNMLSL